MTPTVSRQTLLLSCSAVFLAGTSIAPSPALAQQGPEFIDLTGVVRDFRERGATGGHPDFERQPDHGFGLYVGYVAPFLGEDGKPIYSGAGYKVYDQWRDNQGRPIAPHLYNSRFAEGDTLRPADMTILKDSADRDAFEITLIDATFNSNGTSTWSYRVREIGSQSRDLSHWNVKLDPGHVVIEQGTTPGYEVGIDGSTGFYGIKWDVSDGFEDQVFTFVLAGMYVGVNDSVGVLAKGGNAPDVGPLFVPSADESPYATPFEQPLRLVYDPSIGDSEGSRGSSDGGAITSMETFNQWYENVQGMNLTAPLTIRFVRQEDGSYVFDDSLDPMYQELGGFFPIEGELFGNPGGSPDRNFHFTFELHTTFTYDANAGQYFRFTGDDDVWVFIDGKLAIDLGGVHAQTDQYCDMSRLGLEDGEIYNLDFYFAERHRTQSNFRIVTNMTLQNPGPAGNISAIYD